MGYSCRVNDKTPRLEGRVRDVVASGDAVVETARGVVFARGALVGERVRLALEPKRGRVQRGRVLALLDPSPERVEPPCRYVRRCGGCALMHASAPLQRSLRRGFLRRALQQSAVFVDAELHETPSELALGYRRRARLAFRVAGRARELGFRREASRDITDVERCLVLVPALADALTVVRTRVLPELAGEGELRLALGATGAVMALESTSPQSPAFYGVCEQLVREGALAGSALFLAGTSKPALFGDAREWSEGSDGEPLEGTISGFAQAHGDINRALVLRVVERARCEGLRVLELYAGAGNFTVALARHAASYTAIEQAPDAVLALQRNLKSRALTVKVVEGDVAGLVGRMPACDVALLDPPRTGAPGVLAELAAKKVRRIVYVSCDPATLARDLAELGAGYTLSWLETFEMFPQTAELETLAVLERVR